MPKKISVDEIVARRKDLGAGTVTKAAKSPASWNKDARSARYVMNAQSEDRYGDIVVTAGIDTAQFEKNPVGLLFHSSRSWPIGMWSNLEKILKGRPPRIEGDLNLLPEGGPVPEIDQAAWMIENGGIRACSIGFRPNWDEAEMILDEEGRWTGGIKWNASELLECSVCAVGASPEALIKDASGDWNLARELIEEVLDSYARTPEGLLVPRKDYEAAYRLTVEKIATDAVEPENKAVEVEQAAKASEALEDANAAVEKDAAELGDVIPEEKGTETLTPADAPVLEHEKKSAAALSIEIDTTEATEKVNALSKLFDALAEKMNRFFGTKSVEPQTVEPAAPPSAEAVEAAKLKAASIRDRLAQKGLIEA